MIIGTAGHIDHGKTALVKALTGVDCDRLKEEKARGITIDLGFAYLPIAQGQVLGFVDVPGHERFVHTMLAGASGIDFALLTVAADDGIKPQTLEHLAILDLLGIDRGVVVVTKADLATPERLEVVTGQIRTATSGTVLEGADILPVSASTGHGVDALRTLPCSGRHQNDRPICRGPLPPRGRPSIYASRSWTGRHRHRAVRFGSRRQSGADQPVGTDGAGALAPCPEQAGGNRASR